MSDRPELRPAPWPARLSREQPRQSPLRAVPWHLGKLSRLFPRVGTQPCRCRQNTQRIAVHARIDWCVQKVFEYRLIGQSRCRGCHVAVRTWSRFTLPSRGSFATRLSGFPPRRPNSACLRRSGTGSDGMRSASTPERYVQLPHRSTGRRATYGSVDNPGLDCGTKQLSDECRRCHRERTPECDACCRLHYIRAPGFGPEGTQHGEEAQ